MRDHAAGPTQHAASPRAPLGCRRRIPAHRLSACIAPAVLAVLLACSASLAQPEVVEWPDGPDKTYQEGDLAPVILKLRYQFLTAFTVRWEVVPVTVTGLGSAADTSDCDPATGIVTLNPGDGPEVNAGHVRIVDDTLAEGQETFEFRVTEVIETAPGIDPAAIQFGDVERVVIEPSDPVTLPTLSINNASADEGDAVSFTVALSEPSEDAVTVEWVTAPDGGAGANPAQAGADYNAVTTAQTLTFPAGDTEQTIMVQTLEDSLDEPDETFLVRLSNPGGATITRDEATGTIVDDDLPPPPPTLSINDARADEGDAAFFTVTRSGAAGDVVSVQWMTATDERPGANAAQAAIDYGAVRTLQTLTFAAGETAKTIVVQTLEDNLQEPDETFLVRLSNPSGAEITRDAGTGTIVDDDQPPPPPPPPPPTLSINDAEAAEGEDVVFTVTLSRASGNVVSVHWETAPDRRPGANPAQAGADYTAVQPPLVLIFAPGETEKTVDVWTFEDDLDEPDETFLVLLSDPVGATIERGTGIGTIVDDDLPPTLSINDASAVEGDDVVFTVTRSGATGNVVSVQWNTAPDGRPGANPAQPGADYAPVTPPQTLTFAAGETEKTVAVQTFEDDLHEPDETFLALLSNPVGAAITRGTGIGTIVDDDLPPTLWIDDARAPEGDDVVFTVTRSGATGNVVSVQWNTAPDGRPGANAADAGADYAPVAPPQTLTFAAGETEKKVAVQTFEDDLHESDETFLALLSNAVGATITRGTGIGTIADGDLLPTLWINDAGAAEGDDAVFRVTRGGATGNVVSVRWGTALDERPGAHAADAGADYAPVTLPQTLTFAAGETEKTVAVETFADDLHELDETFLARLSNPVGATISRGTGIGTIADGDLPPALSISDARAIEGDGVVFTVTRGGATGNVVSVRWETAPDGRPDADAAQAPADYAAVTPPQTLTFAAGETEKTVVVLSVQDDLHEPDETFLARLREPVGAIIERGTGTGTIADDDLPPTLSINDAGAVEGDGVVFTVTRGGATGNVVSVQWETAPDGRPGAHAAQAPVDYAAVTPPQTLTFAAGETEKTVVVLSVQDDLHEPDETFLARLREPVGASIERGTGTGTIADDDLPPTLSINDARAVEGDGVVFTVTRGGATGNVVSVRWETAPDGRPGADAAQAPADYAAVTPPQTLTFAAGETEKTVVVRSVQDDLHEPDETFLARLGEPLGATITRDTGVGTIADDDLPPTLSINDARAVEGDGVVFTVTRGGATGNVLSVRWETAPDRRPGADAAQTPADYAAVTPPQTLTFAAGETQKRLVVQTIEDVLDEPDETFLARLREPVGATVERGTGTGTIADDDLPPTLTIHDAAPAEEGAPAVFMVTLPEASGRAVTAHWQTVSGSATEDADYVGAAGMIAIPAGETTAEIRVATIDDDQIETPEEAFLVTLSAPVHAVFGREAATGTIVDDDRPQAVERLRRVNDEILPRVGSALMRRNLDRLLACIDHAKSRTAAPDLPGLTGTLAGYAAARAAGSDLSWWQALGGTRLAVRAEGEPSGRRTLGLCGGSDWQRMKDDGPVVWEGELVGAHLGGHLRLENNFVLGVGVTHDRGAFDWRDRADAASGVWRLRLTGVQPYAAWFAENAARLWAMGSTGSGTVEMEEHTGAGARQRADVRQLGAAAGGSWPLKTGPDSPGRMSTRLRIEGWVGRLEIADNGDLVTAVSVATEGVRGLLESAWHYALGDGKRLTPSLWAGLQHDDGAGGTGFESGAGLRWEDRARGFSARLEGRTLLVDGAVREWGAGADVRLGRRDALGPSLHSSLSWGDRAAGTAALWERDALWQAADGHTPPGRLAAEVGYGLRSLGGRGVLTPYSGLTFTESAAHGQRVGIRLHVASALEVNLEGEWRQAADGTTDRRVALVGTLRFDDPPTGRMSEPEMR